MKTIRDIQVRTQKDRDKIRELFVLRKKAKINERQMQSKERKPHYYLRAID